MIAGALAPQTPESHSYLEDGVCYCERGCDGCSGVRASRCGAEVVHDEDEQRARRPAPVDH